MIHLFFFSIFDNVKESQLDIHDFISASSGEEMSIAIRHQAAIGHLWNTPLFLIGSDLPQSYKDSFFFLRQKIILFPFNYEIQLPFNFFQEMTNNIDLFQRKIVWLYLKASKQYAGKYFYRSVQLPEQMYRFLVDYREGIDLLFAFLQCGPFEFDNRYDMRLKDFKELYALFRKSNGEEKCKWIKDHYHATFQERGLKIVKKTKERNGEYFTGEFVIGLRLSYESD